MAGRLFILCTHGPEAPERATIPFVMATAALASDVEVVMGFQADGVWLAAKGGADNIQAPGFPPLKDVLATYQEAGGTLLVCGPCMQSRGIDAKTALVEGATVVGAVTFVEESMKANATMTY